MSDVVILCQDQDYMTQYARAISACIGADDISSAQTLERCLHQNSTRSDGYTFILDCMVAQGDSELTAWPRIQSLVERAETLIVLNTLLSANILAQ